MRKTIFYIAIIALTLASCKKKYTVWIGWDDKSQMFSTNNYKEIIIKAKNDLSAYEKALILYYKTKKELSDRNSDTVVLDLHEGTYIQGVNVFYNKDDIKLTANEKRLIEEKILHKVKQGSLND